MIHPPSRLFIQDVAEITLRQGLFVLVEIDGGGVAFCIAPKGCPASGEQGGGGKVATTTTIPPSKKIAQCYVEYSLASRLFFFCSTQSRVALKEISSQTPK